MSDRTVEYQERAAGNLPTGWLAAVADAADDAIIVIDLVGGIVFWNSAAQTMFGHAAAEMIGRQIDVIIPHERFAEEISILDGIRRGARVIHYETEGLRKDGSLVPISLTLSPIRDERGRIVGTSRVARDISDMRHLQRELHRGEALLRSISATAPIALITIDDHGIIRSFSDAAERMFGYTATEVAGHDVSLLMPSQDRDRHDGRIGRYLRSGELQVVGTGRVATGQRKDGSTFPLRLTLGEVNLADEHLYTGFLQDLTELQASERLLSETQAELIFIARMNELDNMAVTLAHEVTQPLTAISNYIDGAELMLRSGDQEGALRAMRRVTEQADRAWQIIQRLRTLVKKSTRRKRIEDLTTTINEACSLALTGIRPRPKLTVRIADDADQALIDKVQIQQVLLNLIRNAMEAMDDQPRRELTITTARDGDMVEVRVADTGTGLPAHIRNNLFQPFVSTKPDGMGVGLSVCRLILDGHGGGIRAGDADAGGTVVTFTVPHPAASPPR